MLCTKPSNHKLNKEQQGIEKLLKEYVLAENAVVYRSALQLGSF